MILPDKIQNMELYQPVTENLPIRLDANESFIPMEKALLDEISAAVAALPLHRYPDPCAAEVCRLAAEYFGTSVESTVAGNGSDELISIILSTLLPRGGRLLVCDPDFSMYRFYAALYECKPLSCNRQNGLPDLQELCRAAQTADALILSNPCNPTGQGISRQEMLSIVRSTSALCIIDEAYMDFWDQSIITEIERNQQLIVLKTCSKNIGLAGIRLGFAFAHPELAAVLRAVKSPYNVNAITQVIGRIVLSHPETLRRNTERILDAKRTLLRRLSETLPQWDNVSITDTAANFLLLTLPNPERTHQLLRERGIAVRLLPGALRITAGAPEETDALISALEQVFNVT